MAHNVAVAPAPRSQRGYEKMIGPTAKGIITGAGFGVLAGLAVGASTGAESADDDDGLAKSILYALSELAVDTEMNAVRIEALSARIDDLEARLDGFSTTGK